MLKGKTKKNLLYLKFNMLSCSNLVVQETHCCIMLHGDDFSKIGGYDFSKIGVMAKLGGLLQCREGCNPVAYYDVTLVSYGSECSTMNCIGSFLSRILHTRTKIRGAFGDITPKIFHVIKF